MAGAEKQAMAARSTEYRLQPSAGLRILRAITGLKRVRKGSITFEGKRIDGLDPAAIVRGARDGRARQSSLSRRRSLRGGPCGSASSEALRKDASARADESLRAARRRPGPQRFGREGFDGGAKTVGSRAIARRERLERLGVNEGSVRLATPAETCAPDLGLASRATTLRRASAICSAAISLAGQAPTTRQGPASRGSGRAMLFAFGR